MKNQGNLDGTSVAGIPTEPVGSVPRPHELQTAMLAHANRLFVRPHCQKKDS